MRRCRLVKWMLSAAVSVSLLGGVQGSVYAKVKPFRPDVSDEKKMELRLSVQALTDDSMLLNWGSEGGTAVEYLIYRSLQEEGDFEIIDTVYSYSGNRGGQYVDRQAIPGTEYFYRVQGFYYGDEGLCAGAYSNTSKGLIPLRMPVMTLADAGDGTVQIKWGQVSGAKGYEVQRSFESGSGFRNVKTLGIQASWENSGLTLGKKVYYQVRPYSYDANQIKIYGPYSSVKGITPTLAPVKTNAVSMTRYDTAKLSWSRLSKTQGYVIYQSTDYGQTYHRIKTIANAGTLSYSVKRLQNGQMYYYKIRGYRRINGTTIYGLYSSTRTRLMNWFGYEWEPWADKAKRIFGRKGFTRYATAGTASRYMKSIAIKVWDFNGSGKKVTKTKYLSVHRNIAPTVQQIFKEIYQGKERFPIKSIGGYSWRGNGSASEHCLGVAIDINPTENYMIDGKKILAGSFWRPNKNPYSIPANGDVVKIMRKYGMYWGIWGDRRDYMHFSYFGT